MKTRMFFVLALSMQLLLGIIPSFGQTNSPAAAVLKRGTNVPNMGTNRIHGVPNEGTGTDRDYLIQIRNQAAQYAGNTAFATNELPVEIANLEWTGQYAERFLRIPEGNSGKPKLVRFLIPVYREQSTKPEASVGTEDKQEQDRKVTEVSSAK